MLTERLESSARARRLFDPPGAALLAVSGGADSIALLDLLHRVRDALGLTLLVAHADHGIRPESGAVAELARQAADRYGLPIHVGRLGLGPGASETRARAARYRWLRSVQREVGARYLVTAHHRDDQVETILLRVLEGSGIAGLAGIRARGPEGLRRPLLPFRRAELREYLRVHGLPFDDDPMNADPRHLRSWVRVGLLPLLVERLGPDLVANLLRLGRHAAADRRAWDRALAALAGLDLTVENQAATVARGVLRGYDKTLSVAVLRALARRAGAAVSDRAARRVRQAIGAPSGRRVELGGGWVAEIAFDRLRLARSEDAVPAPVSVIADRGGVGWGQWRLTWKAEPAPTAIERGGWSTWVVPEASLEWRAPRRGDSVRPLGGVGHRPVARLLMEAKVPRSERTRYPLLVSGNEVIWIPGICRGETAVPPPGGRAVRIDADVERVSEPVPRP